jgi:hypothetical protein
MSAIHTARRAIACGVALLTATLGLLARRLPELDF